MFVNTDYVYSFDIETIPNWKLPEDIIPKFNPDSVKVGNLKNPELIDAKINKAKAEFDDNLIKTMSTDPKLCIPISFVGYIWNLKEQKADHIEEYIGDKEDINFVKELLFKAWEFVNKAYKEYTPNITFNGITFDFPVLFYSAMRNRVKINKDLYENATKRYGHHCHIDLMQKLINYAPIKEYRSLDWWLNYFGLGGKPDGMDGSKVYQWWQAGEYDKILNYNESDVKNTCKLYSYVKDYI